MNLGNEWGLAVLKGDHQPLGWWMPVLTSCFLSTWKTLKDKNILQILWLYSRPQIFISSKLRNFLRKCKNMSLNCKVICCSNRMKNDRQTDGWMDGWRDVFLTGRKAWSRRYLLTSQILFPQISHQGTWKTCGIELLLSASPSTVGGGWRHFHPYQIPANIYYVSSSDINRKADSWKLSESLVKMRKIQIIILLSKLFFYKKREKIVLHELGII